MKEDSHKLVALNPVDGENWRECVKLSVTDAQRDMICENSISLAEAGACGYSAFAICVNRQCVGLLVYRRGLEDGKFYIHRLMIDGTQQRKGFGTAAIRLALERITEDEEYKGEVRIMFLIENTIAECVYSKLGFADTGKIVGREKLFSIQV